MLNKKTVDDLKELKGRKVLVRCDFNVPIQDGVIQSYNRIDGALPTIKKLMEQGARVILCSHLGKPKGEPLPELSLKPVAPALSERLGREVKFVSDPRVTGEETQKLAAELKDGEVLLLENTRYRIEETKYGKDEAAESYAKELAALCDNGIFVDDAFGTAHRSHCSNVGVTKYCTESVVGYLMEKEIRFLGQAVENPVRPFVAILGGAKVSDKLNVINNLLDKVDTLIIGGGMAYTFRKAQGHLIGRSLCEDDKLQYTLDMVAKAKEKGVKLLLPVDNVMEFMILLPVLKKSFGSYLLSVRSPQLNKPELVPYLFCISGIIYALEKVVLLETVSDIFSFFPFFVLTRTTPLAAAEP